MTAAATGESNVERLPTAPARVAIVDRTGHDPSRAAATALAEQLRLPITHADDRSVDLHLVLTDKRLELRDAQDPVAGPVYVDFIFGSAHRRRQFIGHNGQPLARAVGLQDHRPTVLDATAGLGRDAFRLAALGCHVMAVERSPVLAALLRDGVARAGMVPELADLFSTRFELIVSDAREVLSNMSGSSAPDVVYIDPMFPPRQKSSAMIKKEMRLLRRLVGRDDDAGDLLTVARDVARRRVVVKRPHRAPPLQPDPTVIYKGKIARFDVYVCNT